MIERVRRLQHSSPFLAAAFLALAVACKSSSPESSEVPCTCGTPQADLHGCAHATCLAGETNPANPDCVCGTLSIPK